MLGRVANSIFWLYRDHERAENTARLLAAGQRMTLTRGPDMAIEEWRSVLTTLGLRSAYEAHYSSYQSAQVCDFVLRAKTNPQSVLSMFERARTNARISRSAITSEVWEAINEGWMSLREMLGKPVKETNLNQVLAAIRRETTLTRGATHGSMLRGEGYHFCRLGTFIERADNVARILDVKYYLLLPSLSYVGTALDTTQWDNVLRSLSAERAFQWINSGRMDARSIAQFLIFDDSFPRSLAYAYTALRETLGEMALLHGEEGSACEHMWSHDQRLTGKTIEDIFDQGLHQFLLEFITSNQSLANAISEDYRFIA